MRFTEISSQFKFFKAKVRVKQPGYSIMIDTTITAKNRDMARRLIRHQYGSNALVGDVREIK